MRIYINARGRIRKKKNWKQSDCITGFLLTSEVLIQEGCAREVTSQLEKYLKRDAVASSCLNLILMKTRHRNASSAYIFPAV